MRFTKSGRWIVGEGQRAPSPPASESGGARSPGISWFWCILWLEKSPSFVRSTIFSCHSWAWQFLARLGSNCSRCNPEQVGMSPPATPHFNHCQKVGRQTFGTIRRSLKTAKFGVQGNVMMILKYIPVFVFSLPLHSVSFSSSPFYTSAFRFSSLFNSVKFLSFLHFIFAPGEFALLRGKRRTAVAL